MDTPHPEEDDALMAMDPLDVVEHCRKNGLDKAEERKLLRLFGRFASRHELQMNTRRPPPKAR